MDKVSHEKKTEGKSLDNQTPQLIEWQIRVCGAQQAEYVFFM